MAQKLQNLSEYMVLVEPIDPSLVNEQIKKEFAKYSAIRAKHAYRFVNQQSISLRKFASEEDAKQACKEMHQTFNKNLNPKGRINVKMATERDRQLFPKAKTKSKNKKKKKVSVFIDNGEHDGDEDMLDSDDDVYGHSVASSSEQQQHVNNVQQQASVPVVAAKATPVQQVPPATSIVPPTDNVPAQRPMANNRFHKMLAMTLGSQPVADAPQPSLVQNKNSDIDLNASDEEA